MRRLDLLAAGALTALALVVAGAPASAASPPDLVTPLECLRAWDDDDPEFDYIGEGWADAPVAVVEEVGVTLTCGDERSGVIHIAHPDADSRTGSGHPITPETEEDFLWCFRYTVLVGERGPDPDFPDTRIRFDHTFQGRVEVQGVSTVVQQTATAYVDRAGGFVWTFFTSKNATHPDGNNWTDCAGSMV
jgi:hypothetical protein